MADRAEIDLVIGPDGTVRLSTKGLKGQTCLDETQALEKAVGKVKKREKTAESYQQAAGAKTGVKGR